VDTSRNRTRRVSIVTPTYIQAILFLVVCRLLPPSHLIPIKQRFPYLFSMWDVVWLCIHRVEQNAKQKEKKIDTDSVNISGID